MRFAHMQQKREVIAFAVFNLQGTSSYAHLLCDLYLRQHWVPYQQINYKKQLAKNTNCGEKVVVIYEDVSLLVHYF
jgi:hypothetical protein